MVRFRWGHIPDDVGALFHGAAVLLADPDPHELEHLEILRHHPGFRKALEGLQEDLEAADLDFRSSILEIARADPEKAPYPVRCFSKDWGLTPAASTGIALFGINNFEDFARDSHGVVVWETPAACTIRIPRPITPVREETVRKWLRSKRREAGPTEKVWGKADKRRYDQSDALMEALPWFDRWIGGEEPAAIWRDVHESRPKLTHDAFVAQLIRVWERMRSLSPDGIPSKRPSKASG